MKAKVLSGFSKSSSSIYQKLIYSTVSILTVSTILNYFYSKYILDSYFLTINFVTLANQNWSTECSNQILEYLPSWHNESMTQGIAICKPHCSRTGKDRYKSVYDGACMTLPIFFENEKVDETRLESMTYAEATVPCFLNLSSSKIPNAGRGIYTMVKLPKGLIFGPYEGEIRSAYGAEGDQARDGGYAWRIFRENEEGAEDDFFVDGVEEKNSNWLRYVNSARYEEEQNLYVLMFNDSVYYLTYKEIEPDAELLVWYGKAYADYLNIGTVEGSDHDWDSDFAPKLNIVVCESCERKPTPEPEETDDQDSAEPSSSEVVDNENDENRDKTDGTNANPVATSLLDQTTPESAQSKEPVILDQDTSESDQRKEEITETISEQIRIASSDL